jgi:hypothetical protein
MSSPSYEERRLDTYEKLVASKLRSGDTEWLAERLTRVYRVNLGLVAANQELRARNQRLETELIRCRQRRGHRSSI